MQAEAKQTRLTDPILAELEQEAVITNRLLDVIPEDKLSFRPHPKAKSLGELAMHLAMTQGQVAELGQCGEKEAGNFPPEIEATSRAQIVEAFAESMKKAKEIVGATSDADAVSEWKLTKNGSTIMSIPRMALWRSIMLNHAYHHRGQLSAYLRELDVALPSIYGPSADTDPFA
ncbi:MAG: DinB family protein [Pyrinomonadaceae bacterium]